MADIEQLNSADFSVFKNFILHELSLIAPKTVKKVYYGDEDDGNEGRPEGLLDSLGEEEANDVSNFFQIFLQKALNFPNAGKQFFSLSIIFKEDLLLEILALLDLFANLMNDIQLSEVIRDAIASFPAEGFDLLKYSTPQISSGSRKKAFEEEREIISNHAESLFVLGFELFERQANLAAATILWRAHKLDTNATKVRNPKRQKKNIQNFFFLGGENKGNNSLI